MLKEKIINWEKYKELIKKHELEDVTQEFKNLLSSIKNIPEFDLLNHQFSRLKKNNDAN